MAPSFYDPTSTNNPNLFLNSSSPQEENFCQANTAISCYQALYRWSMHSILHPPAQGITPLVLHKKQLHILVINVSYSHK
jgi:hypothetical protein